MSQCAPALGPDCFSGSIPEWIGSGAAERLYPADGFRVEVLRNERGSGYIAFTIPSTIFFASENSIMVLSRKNSSFSIPA